jgi:P27 family predicted phage terminase small subunit
MGGIGSGKKPLPSEWKVITGHYKANPQRRNPNEPTAPSDEPEMPEDLDEAGQWKWLETIELMRQMGTLSSAYADLLRLYAETWSLYLSASARVKKMGVALMIKDDKTGKIAVKPNPFEVSMRMNRKELVRMEAELGLTPSAKSRLTVPKKVGAASRKRQA